MPIPFVKNGPRINRKGRPKKGQSLIDILNWVLDQKVKIKDGETGEEKSLCCIGLSRKSSSTRW
jgi:hypothetical protein